MPDHVFFWFRRDLRLQDNAGLFNALNSGPSVIPVFIFDSNILDDLNDKRDRRVSFIVSRLIDLQKILTDHGSGLCVRHGDPQQVWGQIFKEYGPGHIYCNGDYEPYALQRDRAVAAFCKSRNVTFNSFKDQVVFEMGNVLKPDGKPYTVFTPFKKRWLQTLTPKDLQPYDSQKHLFNFAKGNFSHIPSPANLGFVDILHQAAPAEFDYDVIRNYHYTRDFPALNATSRLGVHLRFGTISVRKCVQTALDLNETWLSELIWREFFMMVLYHFPHVGKRSFRPAYDDIQWENDEKLFSLWCQGLVGYPMVDAGMRELNTTGYMHNRVRMVTASFLCKHLLIDWRWGERYFADKLLDYDLSANNGNWQWAAGTGCDAAPYFRVFNPEMQQQKFDAEFKYIKKWVPEYGTSDYPAPIVDHKFARQRAIEVYRQAVKK